MAQHAKLSPSSAERWMICPGSVVLEEGCPDDANEHSDSGTATHFLASECLDNARLPAEFIGDTIVVGVDDDGRDRAAWGAGVDEGFEVRRSFVVDMERAGRANQYVQAVTQQLDADDVLMVEQRLPIAHLTGENGAAGTADAVVFKAGGELQIHDLKDGHGLVEAQGNKQLMIYALAALEEYQDLATFTGVRLFIHQPRVSTQPSVWFVSLQDLSDFAQKVRGAATVCKLASDHRANWVGKGPDNWQYLVVSDKGCQWCKAKSTCPALSAKVVETIGMDFDEITDVDPELGPAKVIPVLFTDNEALAKKMAACDLIEDWIKAVRARVEAELFGGHEVPGYKLVQGKKGARQWKDPAEAEAVLKSMRLKIEEMYDMKVISPTSVEKIFGEKGSAPSVKRWNKVQALITQSEGKASVAPASDKRPALVIDTAADFNDETGEDLV